MKSLIEKNNNPVYVVSCLVQGVKLLSRRELRPYLWAPLLINLVLYSIALLLAILVRMVDLADLFY